MWGYLPSWFAIVAALALIVSPAPHLAASLPQTAPAPHMCCPQDDCCDAPSAAANDCRCPTCPLAAPAAPLIQATSAAGFQPPRRTGSDLADCSPDFPQRSDRPPVPPPR